MVTKEDLAQAILEIKELQKDTAQRFQDTDLKFQDTDKKFQNTDLKFQDTDKKFQDTDLKFQEIREEFKDIAQRFKETSLIIKETGEQLKKTEKTIEQNSIDSKRSMEELKTFSKNLSINIDGISRTQGEITEDYFFNILNQNKSVAGLEFDNIERNLYQYARHNLKGEYDIIMFNGNSVLIVEIKNKIRNKDINNLKNKQIANFRELFPNYKDFKIYGAVAGFTIKDELVKKANDEGFFVLQKKGDMMVEKHKNIKSY